MHNQTLYLIRHGETPWTITSQHTGKTDISLTKKGEAQAAALKHKIDAYRFDAVFCSPLKRARQTCDQLGLLEKAHISNLIVEWDYGDYEGKTSKEIHETKPDWNLFKQGAPNGETPEAMTHRVKQFLSKISSFEGKIAIVSHGHFLRSLAMVFLNIPLEYGAKLDLSPASVSILSDLKGQRMLHSWNEVEK